MSAKLTIGYIASSGHSGSTLTDLLLGSQPGIASFGELKRLSDVQRGSSHKGLCSCGAKLGECEVWAPVLHHITRQRLTLDMNDPRYPDFVRFSEVMFSALQQEVNANVIVESSKGLGRFTSFVQSPILNPKLIHVVRDGRAVAYSNQRKGRDFMESLRMWARQQKRILDLKDNFLNENNYLKVNYEDIVTKPSRKIKELFFFLSGVWSDYVDLDWSGQVQHNIGGNRMRKSADSSIRADREYLEVVSDADWADSWRIAGGLLQQLGYSRMREVLSN